MPKQVRVGILLDDGQVHFRSIVAGFFAYAREHGPWEIVFLTFNASRIGSRRGAADQRLDGMVIDGVRNRAAARRAASVGLPAVDIEPSPRRTRLLPQVLPDDEEVGRMVARDFLERGFRQFGCFAIPRAMKQLWSERRINGFIEGIGRHPCSVYQSTVPTWDRLYTRAERGRICRWLCSLPKPVGVLAVLDSAGWHLLHMCREQGIMVPEELSIIGVNNELAVCETAFPPMSSVDLGSTAIGYAAAALLDRLMTAAEEESPPGVPDETLIGPTGIITRRSSDALAVDNPEVARAMRIIAERATAGPLDVSAILDELAISRRWLERQFGRILGRTICEQISYVRLKRAKQLLIETDLPMPAIADQAGFGSAVQLSVVFKRTQGEPPTAYRARHRPNLLLANR